MPKSYTFTYTRAETLETIERVILASTPSEAAWRFFQSAFVLDVPRGTWVDRWGYVSCADTESSGPAPERRLMNWEADPYAEVSDGYLSNMASAWANLRDRLAHQPQYCMRTTWTFTCAQCGEASRDTVHFGKWGAYVRCEHCGKTVGVYSKKFEAQVLAVAGTCGTPLEARCNNLGVPYGACPKCNPEESTYRIRQAKYY